MFGAEALLGRQQVDELVHLFVEERPAALNVLHQRVRLVLGDHADAADAGVQAVRRGEIDDAEFAAKVDGGLGAGGGQIFQARAAAAGGISATDLIGSWHANIRGLYFQT